MSAEDKATLLLRDVPGDVARELDARAETNYRSRSGEAIAILTAVCRGHVPLPVSMDGATIKVIADAQEALLADEVLADENQPTPSTERIDVTMTGTPVKLTDVITDKPNGPRQDLIVIDDPQPKEDEGGDV